MTTETQTIDPAKAEAFAGQIVGMLNGSVLGLMTSIGHRTGLFDKMAMMPPSTSQQIADATGLKERYVREWLGALVTGRIVEYDPAARTYRLPPEHAASITRAAGPNNLAAFFQYMALMGNVEDQIIESFRHGGGVPYSAYPKFQELMAEESAQVFDATLIDVTLPLVPGLVERLKSGIDAADIACGSGHAINLMAKAFPNSRFSGYDFSEGGIGAAKAEAKELGLTNARFEVRDVAELNETAKYDLITIFDAVHDQAQPRKVLANLSRALKPDGVFLCVDIQASSNLEENMEHPLAPMLYGVSTLHCMTVSLALNGEGLGTVWGEQKARELLNEAGFNQIDIEHVEGDIFNSYYVCRK